MTSIAPPTTWTYALRVLALGLAVLADVFRGTTEITLLVAAFVAAFAVYADIRQRAKRARVSTGEAQRGLAATH